MFKSLCIKTNNLNIINYLLIKLDNVSLDNIFVTKSKFKNYSNIIVHYKGYNLNIFLEAFSEILSSAILEFYEQNIIKHLINSSYFYFTDIDQFQILEICKKNLNSSDNDNLLLRKNAISNSIIEFFENNKSLILDGFVNFRLKNYIDILAGIVDSSVNKFVIDREYLEFIDLLKAYVNSKNSGLNIVHLIYNKQESTLLDEFKDIINMDNNVLDTKFISDITFSSNDYALNTLLTLLPHKIYIHLVNSIEDEFINTLKLIFNDRIYICKDCDICKLYSIEELHK